MKIAVVGLWHLGMTYSIGLAELGHEVQGIDSNSEYVSFLSSGKLVVDEPILGGLLKKNLESGRLKFSTSFNDCSGAEAIFITYDTPVNKDDSSDKDFVIQQVERVLSVELAKPVLILSSQLPIGSARLISEKARTYGKDLLIVTHPENLRLGKAYESFFSPDRLIFGTFNATAIPVIEQIFLSIDCPKIWMSNESAEMSKHALNAFLALSVTFSGEISELCTNYGADAKQVTQALKSDSRIGQKSYLNPGLGFAGGTLARDVQTLVQLQANHLRRTGVIRAILESNRINNMWVTKNIQDFAGGEKLNVLMCGLTYVESTDTLRRSLALEIMSDLHDQGHRVMFIEDQRFTQPVSFPFIMFNDADLKQIDILVLMKKLEIFKRDNEMLLNLIANSRLILDPKGILDQDLLGRISPLNYRRIGSKEIDFQ